MPFITDKQTQDDLNLLGKHRPGSVYGLFNKVRTTGGARLLEAMFRAPLSDAAAISERTALFRYFEQAAIDFPFDDAQLNAVQQLLDEFGGSRIAVTVTMVWKRLQATLLRDEAYDQIISGLWTAINVLTSCVHLLDGLPSAAAGPYADRLARMRAILSQPRLAWLTTAKTRTAGRSAAARLIHLLATTLRGDLENLLSLLYEMDVLIAVSSVAKTRNFTYAKAVEPDEDILLVIGLKHPALEKGVGNTLTFSRRQNMLFLTGANMAGKSTLMKAFAIAVYLAHMGFPIAAKEMIFSVRDGLFSSINVPDNIQLGYSHFYAEVLRVKQVAQEVASGKRLVVLFDELFKGTNVKDAYDGTFAVTEAFATYRDCFFIISTHIIELGDVLGAQNDNLQFYYLPTIMEGPAPKYTYLLQPGITADQQGMILIQNEKILEILQL